MLSHSASARYGLIGLPLAFAAIPLYVVLPSHYGQTLGVSLGLLGLVFLVTRLADAFIDPLVGRWVDRLLGEGRRALADACFDFLPARGQLDVLGWEAPDIFAH
jgi:Na+/melibiose symporter-like transporter